ncbi:acyl-CoA dehydrogenase family protein, partial [Chloroflexota bacterium]
MDFEFSVEEEKFRDKVQDLLSSEVTDEVRQDTASMECGPATRRFWRTIGADGYRGLSWPKEYGGQESYVKELIFWDEATRAGAQMPRTTMWAEHMLLFHMSKAQKAKFLPQIRSGEIIISLGYTEPQAGVDFGATELRAVQDRDDYVLNGQKMFSSDVHYTEYQLVAARTDQNVPKEEGISFFMVDLKSPGITVRPIWIMGGYRSNEIFYENIRVPKDNMVGEKNRGWQQWSATPFFQYAAVSSGMSVLVETLVNYTLEPHREGEPLSKNQLVRQKLAQLATEVEIERLWGYRLASMMDTGKMPSYELAMARLHLNIVNQRAPNLAMQLLGLYGQLKSGSEEALLGGSMEKAYELSTLLQVVGGSTQILRNIIALRALGLPHGQASATPYYDS